MSFTAAGISIRINRTVPSANLWTNKDHGRRIYAQERDCWMKLLRVHLRPQFQAAKVHVTIRITSYRKLILDHANLVGGAKPIPDCLKRLGYLYDDAPKWMTCSYEQLQAPEAFRGTVLEILK